MRLDTGGLWRFLRSRYTWWALGISVPVGLGLRLGVAGTASTAVAIRLLLKRLEQTVPFSGRKHLVVVPGFVERVVGEMHYLKYAAEQAVTGTLLSDKHPYSLLVRRIVDRLLTTLKGQYGGGDFGHLRNFKWEVLVVKSDTVNAFVYPGGKVVVYTGLIELMDHDEDFLAVVLGHEIAHAVARHAVERVGFGLTVAVLSRLVLSLFENTQEEQAQQVVTEETEQRGSDKSSDDDSSAQHTVKATTKTVTTTTATATGQAAAVTVSRTRASDAVAKGTAPSTAKGTSHAPLASSNTDSSTKSRSEVGSVKTTRPNWASPQLVDTLTEVLVALPFSRRAEAEADLIGLKLLTLAGYDPHKAPRALERLQAGEPDHAVFRAVRAATAVACTHPNTASRVKLVEAELEMMAHCSITGGVEQVLMPIPYWML